MRLTWVGAKSRGWLSHPDSKLLGEFTGSNLDFGLLKLCGEFLLLIPARMSPAHEGKDVAHEKS